MLKKSLSLIMAIMIGYLYIQSAASSSDPLFYFVSPNLLINVGLIILCTAAVWVSFLDKFRYWQVYVTVGALAVFLLAIASAGILFSSLDYYFSSLLLPLDYLALMEFGVLFGISALSYRHQPVPAGYRFGRLLATLKSAVTDHWPKPAVHLRHSAGHRPA